MTKIFYKFTEEVLNSWDNCTFTEENVKRVMEEQGYTKEKHALKWLQKLCKKLLRKNIGKPNPTGKPKSKSPSPPEINHRFILNLPIRLKFFLFQYQYCHLQ